MVDDGESWSEELELGGRDAWGGETVRLVLE